MQPSSSRKPRDPTILELAAAAKTRRHARGDGHPALPTNGQAVCSFEPGEYLVWEATIDAWMAREGYALVLITGTAIPLRFGGLFWAVKA